MKNTILVLLIVACIIQTAMLWLGDSSGLNFLHKKDMAGKLGPIYPESTWITRGEGTLAYQVEGTTEYTSRQYDRLVEALQGVVTEMIKPKDLVKLGEVNWGELLAAKGIWYEYALPISLEEVAGIKGERFKGMMPVDTLFLRLADLRGTAGQLYLINASEGVGYQAELKGGLGDLAKIIEAYTENKSREAITYQATITSNVKDYITSNTFVPVKVPLEYDVLQVYNPIVMDDAFKIRCIEEYVDGLFQNPLIKTVDERSDGSIILSEQATMIVYKPNGMLEYINLATNRTEEKMSRIEGYNVAMKFITESDSVPSTMKKHFYLSDIQGKEGEYTYYFGLNYGGYQVRLSYGMQQALGTDAVLQITAKGNQIVGGKWLLAEIGRPAEYQGQTTGVLQEGYTDPIDQMLEQSATTTSGTIVFEALECVYVMDSMDGKMHLKWSVRRDGQWHFPR
ncbi:MAG: hypothetical protein ACRCW2_08130 [Cellulosilyticaceae bacterium]